MGIQNRNKIVLLIISPTRKREKPDPRSCKNNKKTRTTLVEIRAGSIRKGILLPFSCWLWWELAACLPWSATVVPPKATCGPVLFLSSRLSVVHQSNCSRGKSWCTLWGCFTLRSLVPSCQKGHRAKGFVSVSRVPVTVLVLLLAPRSSMPVSSPRKNLMLIMLSSVLMYTINLVTRRILLLTLMETVSSFPDTGLLLGRDNGYRVYSKKRGHLIMSCHIKRRYTHIRTMDRLLK